MNASTFTYRAATPSETDRPWPTLDLSLLDEKLETPPPFPSAVLPRLWRTWVERAAEGADAPVDYVGLSLLTATASLIGDSCRVTPTPGWSEPCILWTALVGPPSSGKTPAVETVLGLLDALKPDLDVDPSRGPDEAPPRPLVVRDPAVAAVADVLCGTARGVLLARDEHGGWLGHMARGTRDGSAHAFWLSAWCGRDCSPGRRGRSVALVNTSVSILGTTHPEAPVPALARDDGGVMARFLFAQPARTAPYRPLAPPPSETPAAVAALRRLHDMRPARRNLSLVPDALAAFEGFRRAHRAPDDDRSGKVADWWGKGPGTVLRLAGLLTFLDWVAQPEGTAEPERVPAWAMRAAVGLWQDYLWPHARAALRNAGGARERPVRKALLWLAAQRPDIVSREQIRRNALAQTVNAAGADRVIAELVRGGWLQPMDPVVGGPGRRPRRWWVHRVVWSEVGVLPDRELVPAVPAISATSSARPRPHPELAQGSSGASPAAPEEGDLRPTDRGDAAPAVPAISATSSAGPRLHPELVEGSSGASPAAPAEGELRPTDRGDAAPAVPAISAASSVGPRPHPELAEGSSGAPRPRKRSTRRIEQRAAKDRAAGRTVNGGAGDGSDRAHILSLSKGPTALMASPED